MMVVLLVFMTNDNYVLGICWYLTARSMIGCWHHNVVCLSLCLSVMRCIVAEWYSYGKNV